MGNYLGKVRSNFFLGIRTPWTLSDETVWNRTHRFAAKTFVFAGILVAALSAWPEKSFPFSI
ncbi:MAG: SdpI family protein [Patescibacteria group bacterium]